MSEFSRLRSVVLVLTDLPEDERIRMIHRISREDEALANAAKALIAYYDDDVSEALDKPAADRSLDAFLSDRLWMLVNASSSASSITCSRADARSTLSLVPGDRVAGRYRVEEFLDRGAMGEVYRALDELLEIPVAFKLLRPRFSAKPDALSGFKREVLLARSVAHPNVCRIYDLGRDEARGITYLTMEYLEGETLRARILSQGPQDPDASSLLLQQIAAGLDAAHGAGVIHRDFKSANVMLVPHGEQERAVIMDFGLATEIAPTPEDPFNKENALPTIAGTPAYMSPEQVSGGKLTRASDLYALGVVLFEMTTARLPFEYETPLETALAHISDPPPNPATLANLDDSWSELILRLLSKDPDQRFATASEAVRFLDKESPAERPAPNSLPPERDAFIGRQSDLRKLSRFLEAGEGPNRIRLVSVLGPGGIGKTRLAQRYGWLRSAHWPGGVWFCDVSDARTVDDVVQAVASGLDLHLGSQDPVVQIGHAIAGRGRTLVILDNFERLTEHAEATVGQWLCRTAEAAFLVTTRARLQLPEETVYDLGPLDGGVELLARRAEQFGFRLSGEDRVRAEEIVQRLDGLPLAIELAAAQLRTMTIDQLAARLGNRLRMRAGGKRGRHETLAATLDWSWELLQPAEQSVIAQATVFEGFTLEAAESVVDAIDTELLRIAEKEPLRIRYPELSETTDQKLVETADARPVGAAGSKRAVPTLGGGGDLRSAPSVVDVISSLIDKSWLRVQVSAGEPRFGMYSTIREYVASRADPERARARHAAWFARFGAAEWLEKLAGPDGAECQARLFRERDNLVVACRHALSAGDFDTAVANFEAVAAALEIRGPIRLTIQLGREILDIVTAPALRGRALLANALSEHHAGHGAAREHLEEARSIFQESADRRREAVALGRLGNLDRAHGRMDEAREKLERAIALHRAVGNRAREGIDLGILAVLHLEQGRLAEAREHCKEALRIHREGGNRRMEANVLDTIGILEFAEGHLEEAFTCQRAALSLHREMGNRRAEGAVLGDLAVLYMAKEDLAQASKHHEEALVIHREVGERHGEGVVLANLGSLRHRQGLLDESRRFLEAALSVHREIGNRRAEGTALGNLATIHFEEGRFEEARQTCEAAIEIHREVGYSRGLASVLSLLGRVHADQGECEEARRCAREAVEVVESVDQGEAVKAICVLGMVEHRCGDVPAARSALEMARSIASRFDFAPESEVGRVIEDLARVFDASEKMGGAGSPQDLV